MGLDVETTRYMVAEMKWQARLLMLGGAVPWNEFKEEAIHYAGLLVFTFLLPKCQYIQLAHSKTKFLYPTATLDISSKVERFIGNRNGDQNHTRY